MKACVKRASMKRLWKQRVAVLEPSNLQILGWQLDGDNYSIAFALSQQLGQKGLSSVKGALVSSRYPRKSLPPRPLQLAVLCN
ncbi:hypothetical protein WUBG_00322 [Wuchereria bancrofti]|uniref:Uncharacterized protein n=1 Tax=Wuchereria bancrofti TaxID=6293 RepID=J9FN02_WUCBA|nr:hypothetical protein WUBG_00322 [Wuchereria bancrofti]